MERRRFLSVLGLGSLGAAIVRCVPPEPVAAAEPVPRDAFPVSGSVPQTITLDSPYGIGAPLWETREATVWISRPLDKRQLQRLQLGHRRAR